LVATSNVTFKFTRYWVTLLLSTIAIISLTYADLMSSTVSAASATAFWVASSQLRGD
jgi:hypothetical protein